MLGRLKNLTDRNVPNTNVSAAAAATAAALTTINALEGCGGLTFYLAALSTLTFSALAAHQNGWKQTADDAMGLGNQAYNAASKQYATFFSPKPADNGTQEPTVDNDAEHEVRRSARLAATSAS